MFDMTEILKEATKGASLCGGPERRGHRRAAGGFGKRPYA